MFCIRKFSLIKGNPFLFFIDRHQELPVFFAFSNILNRNNFVNLLSNLRLRQSYRRRLGNDFRLFINLILSYLFSYIIFLEQVDHCLNILKMSYRFPSIVINGFFLEITRLPEGFRSITNICCIIWLGMHRKNPCHVKPAFN